MINQGFLSDDFLLQSEAARVLYHKYAEDMPIYDFHTHLPAQALAGDVAFENMSKIWLNGDHYKWRAMRANGVDEKYITGEGSDWEKFKSWAVTVPSTLRNPLYHWTHMELKKPFGILGKLLNKDTAKEIYDTCNEKLKLPKYTARGLLQQWRVKVVCTTDDPVDSLESHNKMQNDPLLRIKVLPSFRPDRAMAVEDPDAFIKWAEALGQAANEDIKDVDSFLSALKSRHDYFHKAGCRMSDHGVDYTYSENYTSQEIKKIYEKLLSGQKPDTWEALKFKSFIMYESAVMDADKGWTQMLHIGALRNNNIRMFLRLGPDTGFDSMGDISIARSLSRFLNRLEQIDKLPKTILFNLNPKDNDVLATMMGNFQGGAIPGKMQFGSGWWFLDQKIGMENQINSLSNMGLLSRFVGMLTDSRSFLSYSRHEYFRRVLCNLIGNDVTNGELPRDMDLLGKMVQDICFNNAKNYFGIDLE